MRLPSRQEEIKNKGEEEIKFGWEGGGRKGGKNLFHQRREKKGG